jgi:hypothetical protein
MGLATYFLMINATPWNLTKVAGPDGRYPSNTRQWPDKFLAGQSVRSNIESQKDGGMQHYHIGNAASGSNFHLSYTDQKDAGIITVTFDSVRTLNHPQGTNTQLQWKKKNNSPFFLSSRRSNRDPQKSMITTNNPPVDWMHSIYNETQCLKLQEIALPGSHDSGMSVLDGGKFADETNTLTQRLNIADQLKYGARYFDIRPALSGGLFKTGHYSHIDVINWVGGNGQDMQSIIDQINTFTASNKELVILDLSHGLNTDKFPDGDKYGLSQADYNKLAGVFLDPKSGLKHLVTGMGNTKDITTLALNKFIRDRAAVIVVARSDMGQKNVDLSRFTNQGIFTDGQFPLFNSYADESDQSDMIDNQLKKLATERTSATSKMFLLSWTLTQPPVESIITNGEDANKALPELLWPRLSSKTYPNILLVDAYPKNSDMASLAMAINLYHTRTCT